MIKKSFADAITKNMVILDDDEYYALEQLLGMIKKGGVVPVPIKGHYKSLEKRIVELEANRSQGKEKTWYGAPDRRTGDRRCPLF